MTLKYADGPYRESTAIAASAFSKGDILMLDSNSSLSRLNELVTSAVTIYGVALSDSVESRSDQQVPYILVDEKTGFWSDCTPGEQLTPGDFLDIEFNVADRNRFHMVSSNTTPRAKVAENHGTQDVQGQSDRSMVKIRFIAASDNIEYV